MSKQIVKFGEGLNTAQLGGYYRKHNGRAKKAIKKINEVVETETKVERKNLEDAVNKYHNKVKTVLDRQDVKEEQIQLLKSKAKMNKALTAAVKRFFKKREILYAHEELSVQAKKKKELELYNKMLNKFFTEEERVEFEQMIRNNMVVMLNPRQLKSSKIMKQIDDK
tara:strand:- start:561 stop:1061 length:501 start_codon:yes stop_codon:yes gene_type:complete